MQVFHPILKLLNKHTSQEGSNKIIKTYHFKTFLNVENPEILLKILNKKKTSVEPKFGDEMNKQRTTSLSQLPWK